MLRAGVVALGAVVVLRVDVAVLGAVVVAALQAADNFVAVRDSLAQPDTDRDKGILAVLHTDKGLDNNHRFDPANHLAKAFDSGRNPLVLQTLT